MDIEIPQIPIIDGEWPTIKWAALHVDFELPEQIVLSNTNIPEKIEIK